MATRLGKKLNDVRNNGDLWWLRPDGKTEVAAGRLFVSIHRPIWPRSTSSMSCASGQSFFVAGTDVKVLDRRGFALICADVFDKDVHSFSVFALSLNRMFGCRDFHGNQLS